jgi:hypothetical protein
MRNRLLYGRAGHCEPEARCEDGLPMTLCNLLLFCNGNGGRSASLQLWKISESSFTVNSLRIQIKAPVHPLQFHRLSPSFSADISIPYNSHYVYHHGVFFNKPPARTAQSNLPPPLDHHAHPPPPFPDRMVRAPAYARRSRFRSLAWTTTLASRFPHHPR